MPRSLTPFLEKLTSFTRLTEEERGTILDFKGTAEHLLAGDTFVLLGDRMTSTCLVAEGVCGRVDMPGEDRRQITAVYILGDMPDLYSLYQTDATSKLEALTSATILRISHDQIRRAMRLFPAIAEAIARYLISDAAITNEWLVNVGSREAKARLAHLFCEMAVRMGKANGGHFSFFFPLSQVQLSEMCGLSTVHINRSIGALRHAGLVEVKRGHVEIIDWSGLKRLAGFDDHYLKSFGRARVAN